MAWAVCVDPPKNLFDLCLTQCNCVHQWNVRGCMLEIASSSAARFLIQLKHFLLLESPSNRNYNLFGSVSRQSRQPWWQSTGSQRVFRPHSRSVGCDIQRFWARNVPALILDSIEVSIKTTLMAINRKSTGFLHRPGVERAARVRRPAQGDAGPGPALGVQAGEGQAALCRLRRWARDAVLQADLRRFHPHCQTVQKLCATGNYYLHLKTLVFIKCCLCKSGCFFRILTKKLNTQEIFSKTQGIFVLKLKKPGILGQLWGKCSNFSPSIDFFDQKTLKIFPKTP